MVEHNIILYDNADLFRKLIPQDMQAKIHGRVGERNDPVTTRSI